MSFVTNVLLHMGVNTDEEARGYLKQVNQFFEKDTVRGQTGFIYVNDWHAQESMYVLEIDLAIGAFNYLDLDGLIAHLRTLDWRDRPAIQLLIREQCESGFRVIDVFPDAY